MERTPPDAWDQPSNLGGWSVRELVGHATGSATKLVRLSETGEFGGFSEPADFFCADPAARLREIAQRLLDVLDGADPGSFGPAQPAPESATPTDQLMAHLGRRV